MSFWTPLTAFVILAVSFWLGDIVSYKTKGYVSGIIIAAFVYLTGYWTGIIPSDPAAAGALASTGLPVLMSSFGIPLMITHLGTTIELRDLLKEWKTIIIALVGLVGIALVCFTVGTWIFGRVYALAAAPPISGGIIAAIIVSTQATEAGMPEIGAYAMLVSSFQMFVGIPVASFMLKKVVAKFIADGGANEIVKAEEKKGFSLRIFPEMPKSMQSSNAYISKLAIVALIAYFVANLTAIPNTSPQNYFLNPNIAYLLFGIIFMELGFLEKDSLNKAGSFGMMMLGILSLIPGNFASVTPEAFLRMLAPIAGLLIMCAVGIAIFSAIAGKVLGYSVPLSVAIGITAMIGYPGTYMISTECVKGLDLPDEEKQRIVDYVMPKMLVGGFATVTVASVIFAGIIAPLIFI